MGESNLRPIINLANSIVGVSILAMPYCFSQCGILLGTLLLVLCTLFTAWTCKMLMRAAIMTRNSSYENLALGVYGGTGKYITGISIIGLNLGTCIAFFVIIGDLAPPIIAQAAGLTTWAPESLRAVVLVLAALLIAFPLGLCRSINSLSAISICSLLFYSLLTLQLLSLAYPHLGWTMWGRLTWWDNQGLLKCLPIFALAFACQTQLFVIYGALKDPTFRRISSVINGATIAIASLYFLVAMFGFISFGQDGVKGDVLSNFNMSFISQLFRFGFSLSVVVSFPLMIFPCRVSINSLFFASKAMELHVQEPIPRKRFVAITAGIISFTLTIAILIPNVETVLGLTGALMGSLIAFILPSHMFLKVAGSKADLSTRAKVCGMVGCLVLVLSTLVIVQAEINRSDSNTSYVFRRPPPKPPDFAPPRQPDLALPHSLPPALDIKKDPPPVINKPLPPDDQVPVAPQVPVIAASPEPGHKGQPDPGGGGEVGVAKDGKVGGGVAKEAERPANVVAKEDVVKGAPEGPGDGKKLEVGGAKEGGGPEGPREEEGKGDVKAPVDMQSLHKEIKEDMSKLQSRINHLEEENRELKERQQIIEHIQEDDLLDKPEVREVIQQEGKAEGGGAQLNAGDKGGGADAGDKGGGAQLAGAKRAGAQLGDAGDKGGGAQKGGRDQQEAGQAEGGGVPALNLEAKGHEGGGVPASNLEAKGHEVKGHDSIPDKDAEEIHRVEREEVERNGEGALPPKRENKPLAEQDGDLVHKVGGGGKDGDLAHKVGGGGDGDLVHKVGGGGEVEGEEVVNGEEKVVKGGERVENPVAEVGGRGEDKPKEPEPPPVLPDHQANVPQANVQDQQARDNPVGDSLQDQAQDQGVEQEEGQGGSKGGTKRDLKSALLTEGA